MQTSDLSENQLLLWLMSITCGLCAGVNYYCQPLINTLQTHFSVSTADAAFTVTLAQISYALGLLFIVPIGDLLNRTKLIPSLMYLCATGLVICGFSTHIYMMWLGTMMAGLFSVASQVVVPLAIMATRPEKTGTVVGYLVSGLFIGVMLSNSLSGIISKLIFWQYFYLIGAAVMIIFATVLKPQLPHIPVSHKLSYAGNFRLMWQYLTTKPRLIYRALIGGFSFASMSTLFSTIAILMSSTFSMTESSIGLISLAGIFSALAAPHIGKIVDRGYAQRLTLVALMILLLSWGCLYFGNVYFAAYVLGFALINFSILIIHTANQNILFKLSQEHKSVINSAYLTIYFGCAALGSSLGIYAWKLGGWAMTCWIGIALAILCILFYAIDRSHEKNHRS